jgi:hypothetical protein
MTATRTSVLMRVIFALSAAATLTGARTSYEMLSLNTAIEATNKVFAKYPTSKQVSPISDHPIYASVRPLLDSTFEPLQKYFSVRQADNIREFLQALSDLIDTRNRLAKKLGINQKWWWPTGIDLLRVSSVVDQDLLTGRTDNPDKISMSIPRPVGGKLEVTIQEAYTEHGQDRVLGRGYRTSIVTLVPEKDRWVIDEIRTTTTDAYGETRAETLSQRLQNAVKPLRAAERDIKKLPQTLEVRKGVKSND